MRHARLVPAILTLFLLSACVTAPAYAGHGGGSHPVGGGHPSGGGVHHSTVNHSGGHGGRRLPSGSGIKGTPWDQPVLQPDQLPEARLARFVQHIFHPHG
jgi:hypothetical protein